ncbi:metal-dependent hydrolase [Luteolibacter marinus]|uniref:metal-dependent hydrolase n=1 Tax=Luteolibacter marinus TaxID=2776705 RepID=UPI001865C379|nr:metal-dependent hydrolase [Luteolibacter marinus]
MPRLTYYGHACIGIEVAGGTQLLFDPFVTPNGLAKAVEVDAIPADYVLLTHGHEDHVADAGTILRRTGATLVSNFEIVCWYQQQGIEKAHPMNLGGGFDFPFGRVKYVNAVHSSVLPDGTYGGNPGGFVVEAPDCSFYVSGDTALHCDMKLLGDRHSLDFAVLCIGDNFTMGPTDAALAAEWAGVKRVVGVHYDTFPPIVIDREKAKSEFAKRGIELLLPAIGETIEL